MKASKTPAKAVAKAAKKPAAPAKAAKAPAAAAKKPYSLLAAAKKAGKAVAGALTAAKGNKKVAAPAPVAAAPAKAAKPAKAEPAKSKKASNPIKDAQAAARAAAASLAKMRGGAGSPEALALKMADNGEVCREVACENLCTTGGYCRLHYIKNWKKIKRKELILKEKKLNQYIEELVAKYPDKYIEAIRQDLASDKDFAKVISDLDLDEGMDDFEGDQEGMEAVIDTIKRDFEDEGEGF
jgi:hypothetical protein